MDEVNRDFLDDSQHGGMIDIPYERMPRLTENPIFAEALQEHKQLSAITLGRKQLSEFWNDKVSITEKLTNEARKARLIGKQALIQGPNIQLSQVRINFDENNVHLMQMLDGTFLSRSLETTFMPDAAKGGFLGFMLDFRPRIEGINENYQPIIKYRIGQGAFITPLGRIEPWATGDIATTQLTFEHDDVIDDKQLLIENISYLAPSAFKEIQLLLKTLDTEEYSVHHLKNATHFMDEITKTVDDLESVILLRDYFCDLMLRYLGDTKNYQIQTQYFMRPDPDAPNGIRERLTETNTPFTFQNKLRDFIFLENNLERIAGPDSGLKERLHFVIDSGEEGNYIYVPVEIIKDFIKK